MEKQLGYGAAREDQLVTIAFALGREDRVAQVGCDVRRVHLSKHVPLDVFLDSLSHKVSTLLKIECIFSTDIRSSTALRP